MATKKKVQDTVLGGDDYEWELVMKGSSLDIRRCTNCGYTSDFPKDMKLCVWNTCPECGKEMRW